MWTAARLLPPSANSPHGDKLKIIAFSANAFEEDREKPLKAGMDGRIAKPLKIEELLKELQRFVG